MKDEKNIKVLFLFTNRLHDSYRRHSLIYRCPHLVTPERLEREYRSSGAGEAKGILNIPSPRSALLNLLLCRRLPLMCNLHCYSSCTIYNYYFIFLEFTINYKLKGKNIPLATFIGPPEPN